MSETILLSPVAASLQTRTEHSRSREDAEKYRALDTLKEVGLLIPLSELETFHGRVASADEEAEWSVDPSFANGRNDSGNYNVNSRPTLYSGDKTTAQDFADERAGFPNMYLSSLVKRVNNYTAEENVGRLERQNARMKKLWEEEVAKGDKYSPAPESPTVWTMHELLANSSLVEALHLRDSLGQKAYEDFKQQFANQRRTEVHEIVTADTDATVLDLSFDETKLDDEALEKYKHALQVLALPITEGSPVSFNDRDTPQPFAAAVKKLNKNLVLISDVAEVASQAGIDERVALQLGSAYNSRLIGLVKPSYLVNELIKHSTDIFTVSLEVDGERQEMPINLEYVQRFLREAHIVGVKQKVISTTINREIYSVSLFELEKVTTTKGLEREKQATWQKLGGMVTALSQFSGAELYSNQPLLRLLEDVYTKPNKLIEAARMVDGYDTIFDGDVGNWEGFTLAEHTETVLRNFDENYADNLPVELLAPMRLAILAHDVGKPAATARGEKHKQKEYNVAQADDFLSKLGVDERLKGLLLAVIGDGEELAFQIEVRGAGEPAQKAMVELATKTLSHFYGSENVSDEQITSFIEMCKILQVCDGGAYTSMAITNRSGDGKGHHRNAPSFNGSFAQPVDFGKRSIRLAKHGDIVASPDLTPQVGETASKLRISRSGAGRKPPKLST